MIEPWSADRCSLPRCLRWRSRFWRPRSSGPTGRLRHPNLEYDDRWVFTRLRYHPSSSWNHDYPRADRHLAYIVADVSKARVRTDGSNVLDLGDPEIFRHPLVYMSEPGFWDMTDEEAPKSAPISSEGRPHSLRRFRDHAVEQHGRSDAARVARTSVDRDRRRRIRFSTRFST